jgi:acetyl-CoA carboxylase biotin carboxyl carrier protein
MPAVLEAMRDLGLDELEIRIGSERVRFSSVDTAAAVTGFDVPEPVKPDEPEGHLVRAPLAGTFFATPKPGDPPFVRVGDQVRDGDLIGLIEAMKVFNEVLADIDGEIKSVLARSGDGVTEGQALLLVDTSDTRPVQREVRT